MKQIMAVFLGLILLLACGGCSSSTDLSHNKEGSTAAKTTTQETTTVKATEKQDDTKTYKVEELSVRLDPSFMEGTVAGYTGAFSSEKQGIVILVLREEKTLFGSEVPSLQEYIDMVMAANLAAGRAVGELKSDQGIPYFDYEFTVAITYHYYTTVFESEKAFWLFQCACDTEQYDDLFDTFSAYAHSVEFK